MADSSSDEAPEIVGFSESRAKALNEHQKRQADSLKFRAEIKAKRLKYLEQLEASALKDKSEPSEKLEQTTQETKQSPFASFTKRIK